MNRYIIFIIIIMVSIFSANSVTQNELLRYQFEENGGALIFDSSGNSNTGIQTECSWTTDEMWGNHAIDLDGKGAYITTISTAQTPATTSISLWVNPQGNLVTDTMFSIQGENEDFVFYIDYNNGSSIKVDYIDESLALQTLTLDAIPITQNVWTHFVLMIQNEDNHIHYSKNGGAFVTYSNLTGGINTDDSSKILRIGIDGTGVRGDLDAYVDDFRIFDFHINNSQISELYATNTITLIKNDTVTPEINDTLEQNIITSLSPNDNEIVLNPVMFEATTNHISNCELYIDNNKEFSINSILAFSKALVLDDGYHDYFVYCNYMDANNSLLFDISNISTIFVNGSAPQNISFHIIGIDFIVNDLEMYITTPCMEAGFSAVGTGYTPYQPKYNTGGINFAKVENGYAQFEVTGEINKYCLYNGRIIVNEEGKTTNYDPVNILGVVELGNIQTPNNITQMYDIKLDQFDIYSKVDPKAWGTSWVAISSGLILLFLGVMLLIAGISTNNGKIAIGGVLLTLSAMGISISGFVGLLI